MKRKIIFAALAVAMLLSVFAISTSAEYDPPSGDGIKGFDLLDSASLNKIVQLALMQNTLGLGSASDECVIVYYWPSGSRYEIRYWAFTQLDHLSTSSTSVTINMKYLSNNHYSFLRNGYGFTGTDSQSNGSLNIPFQNIIYANFEYPIASYGSSVANGLNPNVMIGTATLSTAMESACSFWSTTYDHLVNYDANIQNAIAIGQSYGYQMGMDACKATHDERTYEEGYDFGYSTGYYIGLYDCDKTHQALKDESFAYGLAQGAMNGYADCQATHPAILKEARDEGYAAGDADGYMRGLFEGEKNSQLELDTEYWRGRSEGYDLGYTEAINTSESVIDFVDAIFSAPINGLYHAFDIEIFGINLFNVFMLFISIIIVGGVVLLVLKFR